MSPLSIQYDKGTGAVDVLYQDITVPFEYSLYREHRRQKDLATLPSPFDLVNRFIQTLDSQRQQALFDFYLQSKVALDDIQDVLELNLRLSKLIQQLSEIVPVSEMNQWVRFKSGIYIPNDLMTNFDDFQDKTLVTRERTYIRDDYIDLVAWTLCLRLISPVWSGFAVRTKNHYGKTWYIFHAYHLITASHYYECEAGRRLAEYVKATIPKDTKMDAAILNGISEADYPAWIVSLTVLRRIIYFPFEDGSEGISLIKVIYKFISQKVNQNDETFDMTIRVKQTSNAANVSDNNTTSVLEGYSSRQVLNDGDLVMAQEYLYDTYRVTKTLDPTIPDEILRQASANQEELMVAELDEAQIVLTQWIINKVIPARMMDYVDRRSLVSAMVAARAWYWHHGYRELALLSTAIKVDNVDVHQFTGSEKRTRIVASHYEQLEKFYPYYLRSQNAKKTEKPRLSIMVCIEHVERLLTNHEWRLTVPDTWLESMELRSRHYSVPEEIKTNLVNLALELAQTPILKSPH